MSNFKRFCFVLGMSVIIGTGFGCAKEISYTEPDTNWYLTEQVKAGNMTQEEADKVRKALAEIGKTNTTESISETQTKTDSK